MRTIALPDGSKAIVDSEDYEFLSKFKWCIQKDESRRYVRCIVRIDSKQRTVMMHRMIMSPKLGQQVDHINGDGLDNRRDNLRCCTAKENMMNRRKLKTQTSRFKGVHRDGIKWRAYIKNDRRIIKLGVFEEEEDAARAYDNKALELFGAFAGLNFPT